MFCKQCGKPIDDGQEICEECKKATVENTTAEESTNNAAQNSTVNNQNTSNANPQAKSKIAAGLLGIFLGTFGVHNFYLGYTGKAIAQLLISILSCGFLAPVSSIWGLIEGILILTGSVTVDGNGNELRD